ncbi:MAG: ATP-binding cassette domain-containing protein [Verrucomicrobiota bacterium]
MMEVCDVSVGSSTNRVIDGVSLRFRPRAMNAVIGPSGCGKTTLVRSAVGSSALEVDGKFLLDGRELKDNEDRVGRVGYVPQFCVAHEDLSVEESITYSLRLLDVRPQEMTRRVDELLSQTGLTGLRSQMVGRLSGGQLRRMALALELVADPELLFCDEVTAGLDPESEEGILDLIRSLVDRQGKTVVNVIHNLHHLERFDWIVVLKKGQKIFEGDYASFLQWFQLEDPVRLFRLINEEGSEDDWRRRWADQEETVQNPSPPIVDMESEDGSGGVARGRPRPAGFARQASTLLNRRLRLFFRDRGVLLLTAAITIGFPLLVVIFALDGIPQLSRLSLDSTLGALAQIESKMAFAKEAAELGSLVSSLILFQVVLLTLTGGNNGAREIAPEADLFFQESLRGLKPGPYCLEKILFSGSIAVLQGVAMTIIVKSVVHFPGSWWVQMTTLTLVSLCLTWLALGFSAWMKSGEKASLLAIYIVGFQLPLSGVVISLPEPFIDIVRLVITTYWGWAAFLGSFRETGLYDAAVIVSEETVPAVGLSIMVLAIQALSAIVLVLSGVAHRRNSS